MTVPGLFVLTSLLLVLTFAVNCHGNKDEGDCILSFVVPRDKVKSSCDMEERVTRRLNSVETKVTLYKQHVQELTQQLGKERQLHQQQLDDLTKRLTLREETPDPLLARRLQGLEEELRKVRALATSSSRPTQASEPGEKPHGRGAGLKNLLLGGRSREEEEKALAVMVKSVVHSEVEKLFHNYTHYVTRYIREQALAFNQVINMAPRPYPGHVRNDIERESSSTTTVQPQPQVADKDAALLNQLEGIRNRLSNSSLHPPHHHDSDNVSTTPTRTPPHVTDPPQHPSTSSPSDHDLNVDINDTSSGDANDSVVTDAGAAFTVTPQANDTALPDARSGHSLPIPASRGGEEALAAKSRMSYNADLNKLPEPAAGGGEEGPGMDSGEISNVSGWKESMIHDQGAPQWLTSKMEEMVRKQVDEAMTLLNKRFAQVDDQMQDTTYNLAQLENRLGADIKHMSQVVNGMNLEMTSVTQGLQNVQGRLQAVGSLEDTVMELKKNITQEGGSRLLATLLDEQGKKVRKMERLTDIYKQSLEHYRNETKLEYRGLRDRLDKEAGLLRAQHTDLWHNVTQHAAQLALDLNHTAANTINGLTNRLKLLEDSDLLQGIDLSTIERQMKTRASRAERDLKKLSEDVSDLKQKTRGLQKNVNSALTKQDQLEQGLNTTSTNMRTLQIEVQLEVLDDWVPFDFPYMKTRTDCFGEQYIRKSGFKVGRLVGVVLCTNTRYKIFLGQSLVETFKNIGDDSGMGEDHCQFVHARSMSQVRVSPFRTSTETEPGFVRTHWGQEPRPELLNIIRPSPAWYECGVTIP